LSIWGKVSQPVPVKDGTVCSTDDRTTYFYTSSAGQVVSSDGNGYIIPSLFDPTVNATSKPMHPKFEQHSLTEVTPNLQSSTALVAEEKENSKSKPCIEMENFIPLSFAQNKIRQLGSELTICKENYNAKLQALNSQYANNTSQMKTYYEDLIREMKDKALQHVELQKKIRKESEERLIHQLRNSEEMLEELRDNTAALNVEHQEKVRMLTQKLAETESQRATHYAALQDLMAITACSMAMSDMVGQIESKAFSEETYATFTAEIHHLTQQHREETRQKEANFAIQLAAEKRSTANSVHNAINAEYAEREHRREVCLQTLADILISLESMDAEETRVNTFKVLEAAEEEKLRLTEFHSQTRAQFERQMEMEKEETLRVLENNFHHQIKQAQEEHAVKLKQLQLQLVRSEVALHLESRVIQPLLYEEGVLRAEEATTMTLKELHDFEIQQLNSSHFEDKQSKQELSERNINTLNDFYINAEVALSLQRIVAEIIDNAVERDHKLHEMVLLSNEEQKNEQLVRMMEDKSRLEEELQFIKSDLQDASNELQNARQLLTEMTQTAKSEKDAMKAAEQMRLEEWEQEKSILRSQSEQSLRDATSVIQRQDEQLLFAMAEMEASHFRMLSNVTPKEVIFEELQVARNDGTVDVKTTDTQCERDDFAGFIVTSFSQTDFHTEQIQTAAPDKKEMISVSTNTEIIHEFVANELKEKPELLPTIIDTVTFIDSKPPTELINKKDSHDDLPNQKDLQNAEESEVSNERGKIESPRFQNAHNDSSTEFIKENVSHDDIPKRNAEESSRSHEREQIESLQFEIAHFESELLRILNRPIHSPAQKEVDDSHIYKLMEENRVAHTELEHAQKDIAELQEKISATQRLLDDSKNNLENSVSLKESELAAARKQAELEISDLQQQLAFAEAAATEMKETVDQETQCDDEAVVTSSAIIDVEAANRREAELHHDRMLRKELGELQMTLAALQAEESQSIELAKVLDSKFIACSQTIEANTQEKENLKQSIKDWTKNFSDMNGGKEPDVKDKAAIKDRYQAYKLVTNRTKELDNRSAALSEEIRQAAESLSMTQKSIQEKENRINELLNILGSEKEVPAVLVAKKDANFDYVPAQQVQPQMQPQVQPQAQQPPIFYEKPEMSDFDVQTSPRLGDIKKMEDDLEKMAQRISEEESKRQEAEKEIERILSQEGEKMAAAVAVVEAKAGAAVEEAKAASGTSLDRIKELEELRQQDSATIDQLDDQILNVKSQYEKTSMELTALLREKELLTVQLDALIKEKRTDVVKRFEEEIEDLRNLKSELEVRVTELLTDKKKGESKIEELKGRAEMAEQELRDRDARELAAAKLPATDEKALLRGQLSKQRDQIILKSKAATAGWDAAASSDEKVDVEAKMAYKKGQADERALHKNDMIELNAALEKKENRITELLLNVAEMQAKQQELKLSEEQMKAKMDQMAADVADTIASLSASGGGGSGSYVSDKELDQARESLDLAQDELVALAEAKEALQAELESQRKICDMLRQLALNSGVVSTSLPVVADVEEGDGDGAEVNTADVVVLKLTPNMGGGGGGGKGSNRRDNSGIVELPEVILNIKRAIVKGTNLWKSNRRDECYDLYLDSCEDTYKNLHSNELRNPLADSITNGKNQGLTNKQRGAVVLRKALDKVLVESQQPATKRAEEEIVQQLRDRSASLTQLASAKEAAASKDLQALVEEINNALMEEKQHQQQIQREKQRELEQIQQELQQGAVKQAEATATASSLLNRARAAESLVQSLRRQLDTVISSANGSMVDSATGQPANSGNEGAAGAVGGGDASKTTVAAKPAQSLAGSAGGGADASEVRKLNRKIKELEAQLKAAASAAAAGGGGGGSSNNNSVVSGGGGGGGNNSEAKLLQRKLKDLESSSKKEARQLETRANKAETALQKLQASQQSLVAERDSLKQDNNALAHLKADLDSFKAKADRCKELEQEVAKKEADIAQIAELFKKETALRKKYKNDLEDLKGAIRVYARCRPMAKYEIEKGCKNVVEIKDDTSLKVITQRGEKEFEFDAVFSTTSTQDQVFEDTKRLVESCLDGFNVCVFAYGQTGSGKTFTMTGSPSMPGLTPKAIDELFRLIADKPQLTCKVTTYFLELYNDNLVDLFYVLDNKKNKAAGEPPKLEIKMDNNKMIFIRNSVLKEATSPEELMDLFNKGNLERHTGATQMNAESSRSHSIFAIMVESYDRTSKRTTVGKLSIVDLAGSERADKTGASADRLKEAQSINKSLSALGDVISALSEGVKFIPYRNNKLTQLMQDSLGGNAKTLMFVNFSPADYNSDETATSLSYASRVKKIVNNASKQAESEEVARLKALVKRLQAANAAGQPLVIEEDKDMGGGDEGAVHQEQDDKVYDGY